MIDEVEMNLSRHITERGHKLARLMGWPPSCYLRTLGCVMGIINQGLTYAR